MTIEQFVRDLDEVVPSAARFTATYFDRIEAPHKRLVWFEQSAHNPPFEEPDLFNRTLIEILESL